MIKKNDFIIPGKDYKIYGWVKLPADRETGDVSKVPLAIFMHGACMGKDTMPLRALADRLLLNHIAVLSFDFFGHGDTGGRLETMTVQKCLDDAEAVLAYGLSLSFVSDIILVGHSQGGLVASILAGRHPDKVKAMALYAPAAVIEEIGKTGITPHGSFDPDHVPEKLPFFGGLIRGDYYRLAKDLHTYETAGKFKGPVLILQGTEDRLVPVRFAKKYDEIYQDSNLVLFEGEEHMFKDSREKAAELVTEYMTRKLKRE